MNKNKKAKILILITVTVIIVGAILWLMTNEQPQSVIIVADDGKAELHISENSLPEGIKLEDIEIIRFSNDESSDFDVVYRLEPDGLQLNNPVEVMVKIDNQESFVPEIWHISGDNFEILDNVHVEINTNSNEDTIISGEITHFSKIIVVSSGFFEVTIGPIDDQYIDEKSFYVPVLVIKDTSEIEFGGKEYLRRRTERIDDWSLAGELKLYERGPEGYGKEEGTIITPTEVWGVPQYIGIDMTGSKSESGANFTCKALGSVRINYIVDIFYTVIFSPVLESERNFFGEKRYDKSTRVTVPSRWFRCLVSEDKPSLDTSAGLGEDDSDVVIINSGDLVRCDQVCGADEKGLSRYYFLATSLETCSNTSQAFLCIQDKQVCYNYLIPRGWQTDSNCCCKDEPVVTYAGDRINCANFKGWDVNGYAVDKRVVYPFGESTKSAAECR